MRKIVKLALRILNILDIILMLMVYPIALYSEITDAIKMERLLEILHIPFNYDPIYSGVLGNYGCFNNNIVVVEKTVTWNRGTVL